jgi:hypothetical protein
MEVIRESKEDTAESMSPAEWSPPTEEGQCQGFGGPCESKGTWQRQDTAYGDDRRNWVCMCPECAQVNSDEWAARWKDYYSSIL